MIAKHVPMKVAKKSNFAELVDYITEDQGKQERVGRVRVTNCHQTLAADAANEVLAVQAQNKRAVSDKTYHLLISFRAGERPSDDVLAAIEDRICEGLGFGEHQRVSAVHLDTDNLHIHLAINKIHPRRLTLHDPYLDHKRLAALCERLEGEYGLERDNHAAVKRGGATRAADMEHAAGVESLIGWVQRNCLAELKAAETWRQLNTVLQSHGLALREQGNGFVVTDRTGVTVKASSLDRALSKTKLEGRLGPYERPAAATAPPRPAQTRRAPVDRVGEAPPPRARHRVQGLQHLQHLQIDAGPRYEPRPLSRAARTVELYAQYQAAQANASEAKTKALRHARAARDRAVADAQRTANLKRSAIRLMGGTALAKRALYSLSTKSMRAEIDKANAAFARERKRIDREHSRKAWADWLKQKAHAGDADALAALRARGGTAATASHNAPVPGVPVDGVTKKGTLIYRANDGAVRDDGLRFAVSDRASLDTIATALRFAAERHGPRINVKGSDAFRERVARAAAASKLPITFTDPELEARRARLAAQPKPAKEDHSARRTNGAGQRRGSSLARLGAQLQRAILAARRFAAAERAARTKRWGDKPNVGGIGKKPPPQRQHHLRTLRECGVVRIAGRAEVLLPRDVPHHVEHQGTQPANPLRRGVSEPAGRVAPALAGADAYIAEREKKRALGIAVPPHRRFSATDAGKGAHAGVRTVNGQHLALIERGGEILVLPIDATTAERLKRFSLGQPVTAEPNGHVKKAKGRSL